jgi:hypothetical protein
MIKSFGSSINTEILLNTYIRTVLVLKDWLNIIYNDTDIVSIYTLENTKGAIKRWFSSDTPVFSSNNTDRHDITEILLKVALNTITQTPYVACLQLHVMNYNPRYSTN